MNNDERSEYKNYHSESNSYYDQIIKKPNVDLNHLIKKVKEEEKKTKRKNIVISAAALSVVAVFGIILTL